MFNITPSTELTAQKEIDLMSDNAQTGLNQLKFYAGQSYNSFWFGDATPMQKMEMLGTQAYNVFMTSLLTQQFIKQLDPDWVMLEIPVQYEVSFSEDGSGTINEIPYE